MRGVPRCACLCPPAQPQRDRNDGQMAGETR